MASESPGLSWSLHDFGLGTTSLVVSALPSFSRETFRSLAQIYELLQLCLTENMNLVPQVYKHDKKARSALFLTSCTTSMDAARLRSINKERAKQDQEPLPTYYNAQRFLEIIETEGVQTFGVDVQQLMERGTCIKPEQPLNDFATHALITDQILNLKQGLSSDGEAWIDHFRHYSELTEKGVLIIAGDLDFFSYWRESSACRDEVAEVPDDRLFVYMHDTITSIDKPSHRHSRKGHIVWRNGNVYEGSLRDGQMHGPGVMTLSDGVKFEGEWKAGACINWKTVLLSDTSSNKSSLELESTQDDSTSDASTAVSSSSTVKMMDTPRSASVLLAFADSGRVSSIEYATSRRYEAINRWGMSTHIKIMHDITDLPIAVNKLNPSIVYIEEPLEGWQWQRIHEDVEFIEELARGLCAREVWRGCVFNFGSTRQEIAEKACAWWQHQVHMLTWVTRPNKADVNRLWSLFMEKMSESEEESALAFTKACAFVADMLYPNIVVAPADLAANVMPKASCGAPMLETMQPSSLSSAFKRLTRKIRGRHCGKLAQESFLKELQLNPDIQHHKTRAEIRLEFEPPFQRKDLQGVDDSMLRELERSCEELLPREVVAEGLKPCFGGLGSLYFSMGVGAHAWLRDRVENTRTPLYFELPISWGGPCSLRVSRVSPGRFCWFEAEVEDDCCKMFDVYQRLRSSFELHGTDCAGCSGCSSEQDPGYTIAEMKTNTVPCPNLNRLGRWSARWEREFEEVSLDPDCAIDLVGGDALTLRIRMLGPEKSCYRDELLEFHMKLIDWPWQLAEVYFPAGLNHPSVDQNGKLHFDLGPELAPCWTMLSILAHVRAVLSSTVRVSFLDGRQLHMVCVEEDTFSDFQHRLQARQPLPEGCCYSFIQDDRVMEQMDVVLEKGHSFNVVVVPVEGDWKYQEASSENTAGNRHGSGMVELPGPNPDRP